MLDANNVQNNMSFYVFCENNNGQSNGNNNIQTSPLNMVTITLMNGTVLNNVTVNPDGSVWIDNMQIIQNFPMTIITPSGTNCSAFFASISIITISYNVIASIFSQVDPVFFNIYKMINGDGSRGDFNKTTFSSNGMMELQNFYDQMNSTVTNATVNFFLIS